MFVTFLLVACQPKQSFDAPQDDTAADDTGAPAQATACTSVTGGAGSDEDPRLALSRLHATVRFFRTSKDWLGADQALVDAVEGESWDPEAALATYGPAVGGCVVPATATTLGAASVETILDAAVVHPGTGPVTIPSEALFIALDLRDLPAGAATADAIEAAIVASVGGEVDLGSAKVRVFTGMPDGSGATGVYDASRGDVPWTLTGAADESKPLVVLTDGALSPEAARAAGALRVAGLASLVGQPVFTQVAESSLAAVGDTGLAFPTRTLSYGGAEWPDVIVPDVVTDDPIGALSGQAWGSPPDLDAGAVDRETMQNWKADSETPLSDLDRGAARAMLLVAHGVVDRFYPYYDLVPGDHDAALLAGLDDVDALAEGDREGVLRALGRFEHEQSDGHGFFGDWAGSDYVDSYLAVQVERVDGQPVIRASGYDDVLPGDTVLEIDGVDAGEWYDDAMTWHSAATAGYLFEVSGRSWWSQVPDAVPLVVRGVDGAERSVELTGLPSADQSLLVPWGGTLRPSGWLDDLGAGSVYFLNLNGAVTTADSQWQDALDEAASATGLVVDMRDYPAFNHYGLASALHTADYSSPTFRVPTWTGPDELTVTESAYPLTGSGTYAGPIVLLVSNKTVSAAENFSMMVWGMDNVTVVGEPSAGTNGNITWTYLPGGYYMYFTGMEVLNPDGSGLHGVGIPLDVEVTPTADDFAAGVDPELEAALDVLASTVR